MFKVKIFTIGKCKEEWLAHALQEYEKRLTGRMSLEWHFAKDNQELIALCQDPLIALHPEGKLFDSPAWSRKLMQLGLRLNFCIGGADGLPKEILDKAILQWSLSPLTFTHQMTRLVLVEQLYRAREIERGSQYHK